MWRCADRNILEEPAGCDQEGEEQVSPGHLKIVEAGGKKNRTFQGSVANVCFREALGTEELESDPDHHSEGL